MQHILEDFFTKNQNCTISVKPNSNITADWVLNQSHIPYLPLLIDNVPYAEMLAEAQSLDDLFVEHRGNDSAGWASLAIHGITSQHTDHYQVYPEYAHLTNDQVPYNWTEIQDRCPVTVDYLKNHYPCDVYHRVRFMRLAPGGYIVPHSDSPDLGLRATNFSLNNPDNCEFMFENIGVVPYKDSGSVIMIANGYNHSVWNRSSEYRYHMIIHGYPTERHSREFQDLVVKSYKSLMPVVVSI